MSGFRKHDRLKVVDATPRVALGARGHRPPAQGEIVEVLKANAGDSVQLVGFPLVWRDNRFELLERAVNTDRNGKPLYVGDIVQTVEATPGLAPHRGPVAKEQDQEHYPSRVFFQARNEYGTADMYPDRERVELVRHHWEPPTPVVQYQVDDRVRVLDGPDRPAGLPAGEILTVTGVITGSLRADQTLIFDDESWPARHFELVEHSTSCSDREGRPLYAGDLIRRHPLDGFRGAPYVAAVSATQSNRAAGIEATLTVAGNGGTAPGGKVWAPARFVELIRHHWEPETPEEPAEKGHPVFIAFDGSTSNPEIAGYVVQTEGQPVRWVPTSPEDQARIARIGEELRRSLRKIQEVSRVPSWAYKPEVDLPDGTVVVLTQAFEKPELHRIAGTFVDAKTGQPWTDEQLARWSFEIVRDPRKDT